MILKLGLQSAKLQMIATDNTGVLLHTDDGTLIFCTENKVTTKFLLAKLSC